MTIDDIWQSTAEQFTEHVGKNLPKPDKRNVLITSALPYVNNVPHLGNIIGCVLSGDVFARFCRMNGYQCLHVSGTDEYGTATEMKALQEGQTPEQICDKYHAQHKAIYESLNIAFDYFGRTSTNNQTEICQEMFMKIYKNGYTLTDKMKQLYCPQCDKFLADRFVHGTCPDPACAYDDARGDQCDKCARLLDGIQLVNPKCRICGTTPLERESEHIYIDLPRLQAAVEAHVEKVANAADSRWSTGAIAIARSWLKAGLEKRCITRDMKWGTKVPLEGYENKVFYVWFDAPIGYLSITKTLLGDDWKQWWMNKDVELFQFVGKDNVAFHSIIFPATQIGTGDPYTMLRHLCATQYLQYEDAKFSKSRGTGVFGDAILETGVPADVWRFYLLFIRPESQDTNFSWDDFALKVNSELLANLGNFINRGLNFCAKNYAGAVPPMTLTSVEHELMTAINEELVNYRDCMERVSMRDALQQVLAVSRLGNKYMQDQQPWVLFKDEATRERADCVVGVTVNMSLLLATMLYPFMPDISRQIRAQCNIGDPFTLPQQFVQFIKAGRQIGTPSPLFKKLETKQIEEFKQKFGGVKVVVEETKSKKKADAKKDKKKKGGDQSKAPVTEPATNT